jgi:formamidopyrimidine-DNA glycosylase
MPELPEIETIRKGLLEKVLEKPVLSVRINNEKVLRSPRSRFTKALKGNKFADIGRRGKMLIFTIGKESGELTGDYFLARLGMTGRLVYFDEEDAIWGGNSYVHKKSYAHKHCHFIFRFEGGGALLFCDSRKFGYLEIVDEAELRAKISKFGPEPLDKDFTWRKLEEILDGRKTNLKAFLLNQGRIAGIGNIYADEILFDAGIMPTRSVVSLSQEEIQALHGSMKRILKKAVQKRGTSFSDYVDAAGKKGSFQDFLKIYGRQGKPCISCGGIVERIVVAGRGTNFCRACQK